AFYDYIKSVCEETQKEKMVVCAIALAENITVTADEENEFVKKAASDNNMTEDAIKEYYSSEEIMYYTLADKVMQFMMDNGVNTSEGTKTDSSATETATEAE
ncbi:MAG: trigger factor, partial [Coprococcus sp.]